MTISCAHLLEGSRIAPSQRLGFPAAARSRSVRDALWCGLIPDVLQPPVPVSVDQEEFEDMIDRSIGFASPKQLEPCHHLVDLLRRAGQE